MPLHSYLGDKVKLHLKNISTVKIYGMTISGRLGVRVGESHGFLEEMNGKLRTNW